MAGRKAFMKGDAIRPGTLANRRRYKHTPEKVVWPQFSIGNIVTDGKFNMKVVARVYDGDSGSWWYECEAVDFTAPFNRELQERCLERVSI